jgi:hypothetical protein
MNSVPPFPDYALPPQEGTKRHRNNKKFCDFVLFGG